MKIALILCASVPLGLAAVARANAPTVEEPPFRISIDAPPSQVGSAAQAHVKVTAGPGRHVNKDFPTSLKLTAPTGVDLPKPTITGKDGAKVEEAQALFDVAYTAKEMGKKTFTGVVSFAVCTATACDPHRENVSFTVDVSGAAIGKPTKR
jgi:hypothetical protein